MARGRAHRERPAEAASAGAEAATHYQTLGLAPSATAEAIRRGYRAKARKIHPDVNPAPDAAAAFARLQAAYATLSDERLRAEYDHRRAGTDGRDIPGEGEFAPGAPRGHYTWSSITDPAAPRGRGKGSGRGVPLDEEFFEEVYSAFFATRAGGEKAPPAAAPAPSAKPSQPAAKARRGAPHRSK